MVSHLAIVRHRLHPKEHVAFSYLLPAVSEFLGMLYNKVEILKYLTEYYLGRSDRVSIQLKLIYLGNPGDEAKQTTFHS
jgi:hypothetical protein